MINANKVIRNHQEYIFLTVAAHFTINNINIKYQNVWMEEVFKLFLVVEAL